MNGKRPTSKKIGPNLPVRSLINPAKGRMPAAQRLPSPPRIPDDQSGVRGRDFLGEREVVGHEGGRPEGHEAEQDDEPACRCEPGRPRLRR